MKHVPNGREERETAREGTREPVNKTAREGTREPVNKEEQSQQQAKHIRGETRGSTTRGEEWNTVLQVRKPTTSGTTSLTRTSRT